MVNSTYNLQELERNVQFYHQFPQVLKSIVFPDQVYFKVIANTVVVLEEHWRAAAFDIPMGHYPDSVAEHVGLVHVVGREDDNPVLAVNF